MEIASMSWGAASGLAVPSDQIAIRAYLKWLLRCTEACREIHGTDVEDWLNAEIELRQEWRTTSIEELFEFASQLSPDTLSPPQECIRELAYLKSLQLANGSAKSADELWVEAETEERQRRFVEAFVDFKRKHPRASNAAPGHLGA